MIIRKNGLVRQRKGFTLIELLVVVSIIALLVSILLPALNRARNQAKAAACKGYLHGLGNALNVYAADYEGAYPALNKGNPGPNPHDIRAELLDFFFDSGLQYEELFCPGYPESKRQEYIEASAGLSKKRIGYFYIVPRYYVDSSGNYIKTQTFPPSSGSSLIETDYPIYGPRSINDKLAQTNPLMTDNYVMIGTGRSNQDENIFDYWKSDGLRGGGYHKKGSNNSEAGEPGICNEVFADGHVEAIEPDDLKPRFYYISSGEFTNFWW